MNGEEQTKHIPKSKGGLLLYINTFWEEVGGGLE